MDPSLYKAAMSGYSNYLQNSKVTTNLEFQLTPCHETVLHIATEFHHTEFAKTALQLCPRLLWLANSSGDTALHIAAEEDHADMVDLFIDRARSSDIETGEIDRRMTRMVNSKNDTALHHAVRRGCYECVELLAEEDRDVCSFVNNANESPLYLCIASRCKNMPEIITKYASSSASLKGPNGLTALHSIVLSDDCYEHKIELLVKWRREMIGEGDNLGMTPLHYAAYDGRTDAIKLFLQYESSAVYVLNNDGESALHVAAFNGHIKALEELLNCRPDCYNMVDKKGRTALHAAVLGDQVSAVEFILKTPKLARLINKADKDGNTPLHLAAYFNFYKTIQIFKTNTKACFKILNHELLTPCDVWSKQEFTQGQKVTFKDHILGYFNLKEGKGIIGMQEGVNARLNEMRKEFRDEMGKNKSSDSEEEIAVLEVNLLVAMLVATVTFAAGFTVPGGLVNNGEDEGLATLTNKPAFKAFIVFNNLAFSSSIFAVLFHFHTSWMGSRLVYKGSAKFFTTVAILAMVLAFCSGTYVVLTKSTGLSLLPYVILACFMLLYAYIRGAHVWFKIIRSVIRIEAGKKEGGA